MRGSLATAEPLVRCEML